MELFIIVETTMTQRRYERADRKIFHLSWTSRRVGFVEFCIRIAVMGPSHLKTGIKLTAETSCVSDLFHIVDSARITLWWIFPIRGQ